MRSCWPPRQRARAAPVATNPAYFEAMYAREADPWRFASSDYERAKYAATLAALPPRRFGRGLEVGCSIGVLTRALAGVCDAVLGVDVAEAALVQARATCAGLPHVAFERMVVPGQWPAGGFDLIVFSEVLYYLGRAALQQAAARTLAALPTGGTVVLVNWRGETGTEIGGEAAADAFIGAGNPGLRPARQERTDAYRIDILERQA